MFNPIGRESDNELNEPEWRAEALTLRHKQRKPIVPPRSWRTADEGCSVQLRTGPRPRCWPNENGFEAICSPGILRNYWKKRGTWEAQTTINLQSIQPHRPWNRAGIAVDWEKFRPVPGGARPAAEPIRGCIAIAQTIPVWKKKSLIITYSRENGSDPNRSSSWLR